MIYKAKSQLEGSGIFTDCALNARVKIGEYTGEKITISEARRRARTQKHIAICDLNSRWAIDGRIGGGPFRWINHSCSPNVYIRIAYGRIEFYTQRKVKAGEELVCDYGESQHNGKLKCQCGSKQCKDFI